MAYSPLTHVSAQSTGGSGNGFTTGAIDTTGADLIVLVTSWVDPFTPGTPTDSKGNSYTGLTTRTNTNDNAVRIWYKQAPIVGSGHTFTANGNGTYQTLCAMAFSGSVSTPFDVENGGPSSGTVTSLATGSITPTQDNELVIAAVSYDDTTSLSIGGSFTIADQGAFVLNNAVGGALAYLIQTTAAAANPTWSWTNSQKASAAIASFKAAAVGGSRQQTLTTLLVGT